MASKLTFPISMVFNHAREATGAETKFSSVELAALLDVARALHKHSFNVNSMNWGRGESRGRDGLIRFLTSLRSYRNSSKLVKRAAETARLVFEG